jgi:hypothetical protein
MICGPCAVGLHHKCTGFLRTEFGFCRCADRKHAKLEDVDPRVAGVPGSGALGSTAASNEVMP